MLTVIVTLIIFTMYLSAVILVVYRLSYVCKNVASKDWGTASKVDTSEFCRRADILLGGNNDYN